MGITLFKVPDVWKARILLAHQFVHHLSQATAIAARLVADNKVELEEVMEEAKPLLGKKSSS